MAEEEAFQKAWKEVIWLYSCCEGYQSSSQFHIIHDQRVTWEYLGHMKMYIHNSCKAYSTCNQIYSYLSSGELLGQRDCFVNELEGKFHQPGWWLLPNPFNRKTFMNVRVFMGQQILQAQRPFNGGTIYEMHELESGTIRRMCQGETGSVRDLRASIWK